MSKNIILEYKAFIDEVNKLKSCHENNLLNPIKKGKWSAKEIIGHLLYWDKFILEQHVSYMADGVKLKAFPDHDLHNEEAMRYITRYDTIARLIEEFNQIRLQLIDVITQVHISAEFTIESEPYTYTVEKYINIFVEHDNHHLNQIKNALYEGSI